MDTEEEIAKRGFAVVDKRGQNNPVQEPPKIVDSDIDMRPVHDRQWESEDYIITINQGSDGNPLITGRALGLANDGNVFFVDVLFPPRWKRNYDWTLEARQRLDTFLQCSCSPNDGPCPWHRRKINGGWLREDQQRIQEDGQRPASKVLEVYFKAESAKRQATRILAPRR